MTETSREPVKAHYSRIHDYVQKVREEMKEAGFSRARADTTILNRMGVVIAG